MGNPVSVTVTVPIKPLAGVAFTLICCPIPPGTRVIAAGVELSVKSPSAAGLELPPQDIKVRRKRKPEHRITAFNKTLISPPSSARRMYISPFGRRLATWG
jgi:hypothetical protein